MEIKRKKITQEKIFETEQKFKNNITNICQNKNEDFRAIGYELDLEFGQKENEHQAQFENLSDNMDKKFEPGYISRARITVKRLKTEEEKAEDLRLEQENRALIDNCTDTEAAEQIDNDETLRDSENENKRSVAFTRVMLVRIYKAFWTEWVNLADDLVQLQADLDEFFAVLSEKQAENN